MVLCCISTLLSSTVWRVRNESLMRKKGKNEMNWRWEEKMKEEWIIGGEFIKGAWGNVEWRGVDLCLLRKLSLKRGGEEWQDREIWISSHLLSCLRMRVEWFSNFLQFSKSDTFLPIRYIFMISVPKKPTNSAWQSLISLNHRNLKN